ncbi:MAG: imidazole glycerol phosphate synthase cyclase subunit [Sediminibacterium sp.]|jgi:cyclase|nr:imidazole glycerol phosphate synthase cyclase subunit [Sediminibacterium sp.]
MLKQRIIPTLLLRNGRMVKGVQFDNYRDTGDPVSASRIYNAQYVDELAFIDIDATNESRPTNKQIISEVSKECFMPLTIGGGIKSVDTIRELLLVGADKVIINTAAYEDHDLIKHGAEMFGSQCIIVGIDVKKEKNGYVLYKNSGRIPVEVSLVDYIKKMETIGAGELFINNISRDGTMDGYDLELINLVNSNTSLPVIACGGAGNFKHLAEAYLNTKVSGLAMASIYHFGDNNPIRARAYLKNNGVNIKEI